MKSLAFIASFASLLSGCSYFHMNTQSSASGSVAQQTMSATVYAKSLDVPGTSMYDLSGVDGISSAVISATNSNFIIDSNHLVVLNATPAAGLATDFTISTSTQITTLHVVLNVTSQTASTLRVWGLNPGTNTNLTGSSSVTMSPMAAVTTTFVFKQVAASMAHACGLATDGTAYCWGEGDFGRLGTGNTTDSSTPSPVQTSMKFKSIATAIANWGGDRAHSCAISLVGQVYCWGRNANGQLGDGTTMDRLAPVLVSSDQRFVSLALEDSSSCGLTETNIVYCWGSNSHGELGQGTTTLSPTPVPVSGIYTQVVAGNGYYCALDASKHTVCWGGSDYGSTSYYVDYTAAPAMPSLLVPTHLDDTHAFNSLAGGASSFCGLEADGTAYCWGFEMYGRLGNGSTHFNGLTFIPVAVSGTTKFKSISIGFESAVGIDLSDNAWAFGKNSSGELGIGRVTDNMSPTPEETAGYGVYKPILLNDTNQYAVVAIGADFAFGITR